jgi:hypothetical protein
MVVSFASAGTFWIPSSVRLNRLQPSIFAACLVSFRFNAPFNFSSKLRYLVPRSFPVASIRLLLHSSDIRIRSALTLLKVKRVLYPSPPLCPMLSLVHLSSKFSVPRCSPHRGPWLPWHFTNFSFEIHIFPW